MSSIFEFVKKQRDSYRSDTITITDGYEFSQYETLRTIELYHNSKFLTGNKDTLGREKPFFNVTKFRVNVATRATDLDTKDVRIESERTTAKAYAASFILNLKNRNWMKTAKLGVFLNKLTHTRAKYGGVLVRKVESDDSLELHVMDWNNMITDQVNIRSGVKIERQYWNPSDLKTEAPKEWKNIDEAIKTAKKNREAEAANANGSENKTPGANVEVFVVSGVLPTCYLRETSDKYDKEYGSETEYARQMHAIVLDETDKENVSGVTLYGGRQSEDDYKYKEYEDVPGRGLGVGVVEDLFEAQVWTNDSVMKKKDILGIAGKWIGQTADQNIAAKNILTDLENGQILDHADGKPITQVNNMPASLPAFDKLIDEWNTQAERVSSTPASITGETMPSGTAFRQVAILNSEAGSLFDYRREEAGLFIQEIYLEWVLPFLVKQIKKDKELTATLEPEELELVSEALAAFEEDRFKKDQVLDGKVPSPLDLEAVKNATRDASMKLRRKGFTDFADLFEDWEGYVDVVTTGEQRNKAVETETLFNLFKVVAQSPQLLQDKVLARIFNQLVERSGLSPIMFQPNTATPQQQPPTQSQMPQEINKAVA